MRRFAARPQGTHGGRYLLSHITGVSPWLPSHVSPTKSINKAKAARCGRKLAEARETTLTAAITLRPAAAGTSSDWWTLAGQRAPERDAAALQLQRAFRGHRARDYCIRRRRTSDLMESLLGARPVLPEFSERANEIAAVRLQALQRGRSARSRVRRKREAIALVRAQSAAAAASTAEECCDVVGARVMDVQLVEGGFFEFSCESSRLGGCSGAL